MGTSSSAAGRYRPEADDPAWGGGGSTCGRVGTDGAFETHEMPWMGTLDLTSRAGFMNVRVHEMVCAKVQQRSTRGGRRGWTGNGKWGSGPRTRRGVSPS